MVETEITKSVLLHWWHYYGKMIYTSDELFDFEKIIDQYGIDKIVEFIVASYIIFDGSPQILLISMRQGKVKELFKSLPDIEKMDEIHRAMHDELKNFLITKILKTYNS